VGVTDANSLTFQLVVKRETFACAEFIHELITLHVYAVDEMVMLPRLLMVFSFSAGFALSYKDPILF